MTNINRIRDALAHIDASNRDVWLKMGMAVKSELGDAGFDIWDDWARTAKNHDSRAARDVWRSIKPSGGITIGTLFHEARANGWRPNGNHRVPTSEELAERRRIAAEQAAKEAAERQERAARAAELAYKILKATRRAAKYHPYLVRKGLKPTRTLRMLPVAEFERLAGYTPKANGEPLERALLVAPVRVPGLPFPSTLELIDTEGRKSALAGGVKAGGYWATGPLPDSGRLVLAEGVATAISISQALGETAVAALSVGNLRAAGESIRAERPGVQLVVAADLCEGGEPHPEAIKAAEALGCPLAVPPADLGKGGDFNDLYARDGARPVKAAIEGAVIVDCCPDEKNTSRQDVLKNRVTSVTRVTEGENPSNINGLTQCTAVTKPLLHNVTCVTTTSVCPFPPPKERPQWVVLDDWAEHEGRRYRPGVYWCTTARQGRGKNAADVPVETWICGPLHVEAQTADTRGDNVGRVLRFKTSLNTWRVWACPMELLKGSGDELRGALLSMGLLINPEERYRLAHYLIESPPKGLMTCVTQTGWLGRTFILPDETIGADIGHVIFQSDGPAVAAYETAGTLAGWRDEISQRAIGNPMMVLALSAAFAGPLLALVHAESGGLHFYGPSSTGKTTLLQTAASVWGGPEFRRTWRATANGLEGAAALFSDCLLALDEISECEPREVGRIVYLLGNGLGKQRATQKGAARMLQRWRCVVLSSGERTIETSMLEGGVRAKAGQQVRLLDIAAERRYGVFDMLHGFETARALADYLKGATAAHYGHAGREFLRRLTADTTDMTRALAEMRALPEFSTLPEDGQAMRAAGRLALIALAGELATQYDITGWPAGAAIDAASEALRLWLAQRGQGRAEEQQIIDAVRGFLDRHGDARFSNVDASDEEHRLIRDRAGWRRLSEGRYEWLFTSEGLREAVKGFDFKFACDVLQRRGWLVERSKVVRINGRTVRVFVIFEADEASYECF